MPGSIEKSIDKLPPPCRPIRQHRGPWAVSLLTAAVFLGFLGACEPAPGEGEYRNHQRLYTKLDSLDHARQECRRQGLPLEHLEQQVVAVLDTIRSSTPPSRHGSYPSTPTPWHVPGVLTVSGRVWMVAGLLGACILSLAVQRLNRPKPSKRQRSERKRQKRSGAGAAADTSPPPAPVPRSAIAEETPDERKLYLKVKELTRPGRTIAAKGSVPPREAPPVPAQQEPDQEVSEPEHDEAPSPKARAEVAPAKPAPVPEPAVEAKPQPAPKARPAPIPEPAVETKPQPVPKAEPREREVPKVIEKLAPPAAAAAEAVPRKVAKAAGAAAASPVDDIRSRVLKASEAGSTAEQIAAELGLSPDHVRLIVRVSKRP